MADEPTKEQIKQIGESLAAGKKIEAIKIYREATGKGLKEAKDFVEILAAKLAKENPEKYGEVSRGSGCASVILCVFCTGIAVLWVAARVTQGLL